MARPGQVRIIAGKWRSRRLKVAPGVRPCQDAQRETIFNILGSATAASCCVDLFAGSGALGLEALSRGAREALFVERSARTRRVLERNIADLAAQDCTSIWHGDAFRWLGRARRQGYDLAFVDPPYRDCAASGWWARLLPLLARHLAPAALVLCEGPGPIEPAEPFALRRSGRTGSAHWAMLSFKS